MLLSVIIPTYKRRETLSICLKQLAPETQNISPDIFEAVVTDDAYSGAPSEALVENYSWLRHVPGPQKGPAANRNNGAKAARGDWLLFLDDDCVPQHSFLSAYIEAIHKNPGYLIFEGSTLPERPQFRLDEEAPINDQGGYLWSCNFLIKRDLFLEMGGFCELYPSACLEDVDFREQLKDRNLKFLFVPEASVIHPWRPLAPEGKYLKMQQVSYAILFQRYPRLKPSFVMTWRTILRGLAMALFVEAPQMKFRGFWRFLVRQVTLLQYPFPTRQSSPETKPANSKAP